MPAVVPAQPLLPRTAGRYALHPPLSGVEELTRRRVGDPNYRGRLLRAEGLFRLRDDLEAAGAMRFADALPIILADWEGQAQTGNISQGNVETYTHRLTLLQGFLDRNGASAVADITTNHLLVWCLLPGPTGRKPTLGISKARRAAARAFFETAYRFGITDANPAKSVEFPGTSDRYVNAFSNDQIRHLQRLAPSKLNDTRTPCALALNMSGAATEDIPFATVLDVDLPHRRVYLTQEGYRRTPRWIALYDDWCVDAVARRIRDITSDPKGHGDPANLWLTYQSPATTNTNRQSASGGGVLITALLKRAALWEKGVTRAESIREWLAVDIFEATGSVEEVALRLGMASLDAAAHIVGYDWVQEHGCHDEPPAYLRDQQDPS